MRHVLQIKRILHEGSSSRRYIGSCISAHVVFDLFNELWAVYKFLLEKDRTMYAHIRHQGKTNIY